MTQRIAVEEFNNLAELIHVLNKFKEALPKGYDAAEVYVSTDDFSGDTHVTGRVHLMEETLTDKSIAYNVVVLS